MLGTPCSSYLEANLCTGNEACFVLFIFLYYNILVTHLANNHVLQNFSPATNACLG